MPSKFQPPFESEKYVLFLSNLFILIYAEKRRRSVETTQVLACSLFGFRIHKSKFCACTLYVNAEFSLRSNEIALNGINV